MTVDWANFTPYASFAGGMLIGIAAAMLLLLNGRIAGISGILGGLLNSGGGDRLWRITFIAGLIAAPLLWSALTVLPPSTISASYGELIIAGLLV